MSLESVLIVSGVLFAIGVLGLLIKRNLVLIIISLEIMFNAVVLAAIGVSRFVVPAAIQGGVEGVTAWDFALTGQLLGVVIVTVTALETGLFLALIFALYRRFGTVNINRIRDLRG